MIYIKSYCYSKHELPFIISQLQEGYNHIEKLILYEYNYTHTGCEKKYELEELLYLIPEEFKKKLYYRKVDLSNVIEYAYNNESLCHGINEPIQRNLIFNDKNIIFQDDDIIIDCDIDEIIYEANYIKLINELNLKNKPLSIKLNQFFFKNNYLWVNCNFSSPTIYKYSMVKNNNKLIKGIKIKNLRDLSNKTDEIHGCHMSWVMPIEEMINKCYKTAHTNFRHLADYKILNNAIKEKKYIFDLNRKFDIEELSFNDNRIPKYLQKEKIFLI